MNLNGKKKYRVLVRDRYSRGGARYQYVLTIRKATPDFYPAVIHHQNPGPGGTTVRKGGAVYLDVISHNKEGLQRVDHHHRGGTAEGATRRTDHDPER